MNVQQKLVSRHCEPTALVRRLLVGTIERRDHPEALSELVVHEQADEFGCSVNEIQELLECRIQCMLKPLVLLEGIQIDVIEFRLQIEHLLHELDRDLLFLGVLHHPWQLLDRFDQPHGQLIIMSLLGGRFDRPGLFRRFKQQCVGENICRLFCHFVIRISR
jgi:hypothetical protein